MKTIDIICPLYNAEGYILNLHNSIINQKNVLINNIRYILTESEDNTEKLLKLNNINYKKIDKKYFSHSKVREKEGLESDADILVFITQDIIIKDNKWLYKLTKDIDDEVFVAAYSRQISNNNTIEKYTREYNYPDYTLFKYKDDVEKYGLKTFFFSDASCAISAKVFKKLNGYDGKDLPFNEDMYIAHKIIMNNYKIKYASTSVVEHSHKLKLKELYNRYKLSGQFFKENKYFNEYKINSSGAGLAKYILRRIVEEKRFMLLLRYPFDMAVRFMGMKAGMR